MNIAATPLPQLLTHTTHLIHKDDLSAGHYRIEVIIP